MNVLEMSSLETTTIVFTIVLTVFSLFIPFGVILCGFCWKFWLRRRIEEKASKVAKKVAEEVASNFLKNNEKKIIDKLMEAIKADEEKNKIIFPSSFSKNQLKSIREEEKK